MCGAGSVAQALVAAEEEQLVGYELPACGAAKLVAFERRLRRVGRASIDVVEEILCVEQIIPQEIICRAMKAVCPAFGDCIQLRSTTSELGCIRIRLYFEFLNFIN